MAVDLADLPITDEVVVALAVDIKDRAEVVVVVNNRVDSFVKDDST